MKAESWRASISWKRSSPGATKVRTSTTWAASAMALRDAASRPARVVSRRSGMATSRSQEPKDQPDHAAQEGASGPDQSEIINRIQIAQETTDIVARLRIA